MIILSFYKLMSNFSSTLVMPSLSCAHIHLLSSDWEEQSCPSKYFDFVSICVFMCLSSIFGKRFHFPFPYFVFSSTSSSLSSVAFRVWAIYPFSTLVSIYAILFSVLIPFLYLLLSLLFCSHSPNLQLSLIMSPPTSA